MLVDVSRGIRGEGRNGNGNILLDPVGKGGKVRNVKGLSGHLVGTVLLDESVETVLAAADGDDKDTAVDHALGEREADAGGGAGDEDGLVGERHGEVILDEVMVDDMS